MGIIVDLIIVAVLILFISIGYKKGLTGSLIKLASFAIALVLAFALYKPVSNIVRENTQIDEKIETVIISTFSKEAGETTNKETEDSENTDNLPETIVKNINNEIESATTEARNNIVNEAAKSTTNTIMNVGSGLVIFIAVRFILFIISLFVHQITKLPVIKQIDKVGGIAYGLIEGMAIILIVLGIISLTSVIWNNNIVVTAITKSTIGEILYNNNIILKILF